MWGHFGGVGANASRGKPLVLGPIGHLWDCRWPSWAVPAGHAFAAWPPGPHGAFCGVGAGYPIVHMAPCRGAFTNQWGVRHVVEGPSKPQLAVGHLVGGPLGARVVVGHFLPQSSGVRMSSQTLQTFF